jgi:hypothetical protein
MKKIIFFILLLAALITAGCFSGTVTTPIATPTQDMDQAPLNKMYEMSAFVTSTDGNIADNLAGHSYVTARKNAILQRDYIDKNLPEMKQLANSATSKKAALLEFIEYLVVSRDASDKVAQIGDDVFSEGGTNLNSALEPVLWDLDQANVHLEQVKVLLKQ